MADLDVSRLISVAEAIGLIDSVPILPRFETVPLEQAQGYLLAEDVQADRDYPSFDKSLMDGFAIGPIGELDEYRIVGEVAAGDWPENPVQPGQAVAIMTGAPLPAGAVCVVPIEKTQVTGQILRVLEAPATGQYIAPRGSDVHAGQPVLRKGQRLEAAQLAVAATVGKTSLRVFSRPRVGVLSTGDEIIPPSQIPTPGQIRDCNSILLLSLLKRMDCQGIDLGHVADQRHAIAQQIGDALPKIDILVISGGMSMGQYDYAPAVLKELGVKLLITKLRIKPGKPFIFGIKNENSGGGAFIFGLPGNPVSALVCMVRLVSRLIRRMQGRSPEPSWIHANLLADLPANGNREFYQPVRFISAGVEPLLWKGSADIFTLAQADGLLPRPEDEPALSAGQSVQVMAIA